MLSVLSGAAQCVVGLMLDHESQCLHLADSLPLQVTIGSAGPGVSVSVALKQDASWFLQQLLKFQETKAGGYLDTWLLYGQSLDSQIPQIWI